MLGMTNAVCMSTVSVTTRKMQDLHYTVVLLSYAVFGILVLGFVLGVEAMFVTGHLRLLSYGWQ